VAFEDALPDYTMNNLVPPAMALINDNAQRQYDFLENKRLNVDTPPPSRVAGAASRLGRSLGPVPC